MNTKTISAVAEGRETAFLKAGTIVPKDATIAQALKAAKLDWDIELRPVFTTIAGKTAEIPNRKAVVRTDTEAVFGVVGSNYVPVSNLDALGIGDDLRTEAGAQFVAAGEIAGGRGVWVNWVMPEGFKVAGSDEFRLEGLLTTSHDGLKAVNMHITPIRLACTNMHNLQIRKAKQRFSVAHTSKAHTRLAEAQIAVGLVSEYVEEFKAQTEALLKHKMGDQALTTFLENLLPARPSRDKEIAAIRDLYVNGEANEFGRGTAYAALAATREYFDHVRPIRNAESGFIGAVTGQYARTTNRAFAMLAARK
jgi:phage/plasmid-like protein (TIGR03299 family)